MARRPPYAALALITAAVVALGGGVVGGRAISDRRDAATTTSSSVAVAADPSTTLEVVDGEPEAPAATSSSSSVAPATTLVAEVAPPVAVGKLATTPRGVVVKVLGGAPAGSAPGSGTVQTPCGAKAVAGGLVGLPPLDVVLDPGHGGSERGALSPSGATEASLNLAVAKVASASLTAAGVPNTLTRTADYRVPLSVRSSIVAAAAPKAFVSIHHNAEPDGPLDRPGTETYYQHASAQSRRLAGLIQQEVVAALSQYQVAWMGDTDAGAKVRLNSSGGDYYGILRGSPQVPSALAELAFITDPAQAALLARDDVRAAEGQAVARAIVRWLRTPDQGGPFTDAYPRTVPAGSGGGSGGCVDPAL